jgi:hypothetical protein
MNDSLDIDLNSGSRSILKVGFLIRASFFLIFVIGAALLGINIFKDSLIMALVCFSISIVLFLVIFKMLNAAFFKESLIVTKNSITVIRKNLSATKNYEFDLDKIKYFGFADQHYTKHPLDNPIVDFTGLGTQEREMQYVIDEGNVKIETASGSMKFGKNMPSWDVEELVEKIERFTGQKFVNPIPETIPDAEMIEEEPIAEAEAEPVESPSIVNLTKYTYKGDYGVLVIEQHNELPGSDDMAYLNGKLAPTGKYQIGEKQFVMVSNGLIYAVRL